MSYTGSNLYKTKINRNIKMMKIKFIANWCSCQEILEDIFNLFDWDSDTNYKKKYCFTTGEDQTHIIFINSVYKHNINKDNCICLSWEPLQHMQSNWIKEISYVKKYYIGNSSFSSHTKILESYSYMLPHIPYKDVNGFIKNYPEKNKLMNYVYSNKVVNNNGMLYVYRDLVGREILKNNLDINIYGSAIKNLKKRYRNRSNIKNTFEWKNISDIYKDYKFSIVIENSRHPAYFSEKIIVPLLCGCVPLYLGCTKIEDYFSDYIIHLTGELNKDIEIISNVLKNPDKFYKKINIGRIKELVHMKNLIHKEFLD